MAENNRMVKCLKCGIQLHETCGGASECDTCKFQMVHNVSLRRACQLCGLSYPGIPLKFISQQFYHLACAFLSNQLRIENGKFKVAEYLEPSEPNPCHLCEE